MPSIVLMKRLCLTIYAICLCSLSLFAQNKAIDSLQKLLNTETDNEKKIELLSALTDAAFQSDFTEAKRYAAQGVALADSLLNKEWQPKFYEMLGRMYANLLDLDSAAYFFDKALKGYIETENPKGQATTYFKIGWVHKRKGELKEAMDADLEALKLMEQLDDKNGIAGAMNRISEDLFRQERKVEALDYAVKAITFTKQYKLNEELAFAYKSAGDVEIALHKPETAYLHYDSALTIFRKIDASIFTILNLKNDRANALKRMGKYKEALAVKALMQK